VCACVYIYIYIYIYRTALINTYDTKYYSVTEAIPLPTFAQIGGRWSIFFPSVLVSDRFYLLPSFFCLFFSANFFLSLWPIFFFRVYCPLALVTAIFFYFRSISFCFWPIFFCYHFFARPPGMHIFGHILLLYTRFPIMNYLSKITIHYVNYK